MLTRKLLPAILLAIATTATWAQSPAGAPASAQPAASQPSHAQLEHLNQRMSQAALEVTQALDQNLAGEVWDNASPVAKEVATRADFVQHVTHARQALGAPVSRSVSSVSYRRGDGGQIPAGIYVNVTFRTTFKGAQQPVNELVTYHSDVDNVWRVAGYAVAAPKG